MTWGPHIVYINAKFQRAKKILNIIIYNPHVNIKIKILLYKSVIVPVFIYSCPICGFATTIHLNIIQNLKNKTLRGKVFIV